MKVKLTHLDKIYFPKMGYTKKHLIEYYEAISPVLLPHIKKRPQSLHRFPGGAEDEGFFQKNVNFNVPDFVTTVPMHSARKEAAINYLICNNTDTLLYLINLGCIELNPWLSKVTHLENPDFAVLDLDPQNVNFKKVIKTALIVHDIMKKLDIVGFCKTSGKRGLHIYFPLQAKYPYAIAREFIHLLGNLVLNEYPAYTSLLRSPARRPRKIYLDYLQNKQGATVASVYSVRPTPEATVSTPLHWDELTPDLSPKDFTIQNVPSRVEKLGDIFADVLTAKNDLKSIMSTLSDMV